MPQNKCPPIFEISSIVLHNSLERWLIIINTDILLVLIFRFFVILVMGNDIFQGWGKKCCGGDKIGYEINKIKVYNFLKVQVKMDPQRMVQFIGNELDDENLIFSRWLTKG